MCKYIYSNLIFWQRKSCEALCCRSVVLNYGLEKLAKIPHIMDKYPQLQLKIKDKNNKVLFTFYDIKIILTTPKRRNNCQWKLNIYASVKSSRICVTGLVVSMSLLMCKTFAVQRYSSFIHPYNLQF